MPLIEFPIAGRTKEGWRSVLIGCLCIYHSEKMLRRSREGKQHTFPSIWLKSTFKKKRRSHESPLKFVPLGLTPPLSGSLRELLTLPVTLTCNFQRTGPSQTTTLTVYSKPYWRTRQLFLYMEPKKKPSQIYLLTRLHNPRL